MAFVDMDIEPPPESTEIIREDSDTILFNIKKSFTETYNYVTEISVQTTNEWNSTNTTPRNIIDKSTNISTLGEYSGPEDHSEPFTKELKGGISTVTRAIQSTMDTVSGYLYEESTTKIHKRLDTNFTRSTNSFTNLSSQTENGTESISQVFDKTTEELIIDRVRNFETIFTESANPTSILETFSSPKESATESFLNTFSTTEDGTEEELIITRISSRFGDFAPTNMKETSEMLNDYTTSIPLEKTTVNDVSERVTEKLYIQYDHWIFYLMAVFVFAIVIVSTMVVVYMRNRKRSYGVSQRMSDFTSSSSVV